MGRKGAPTIDSSVEADLVAAFVAREHDALERAYRSYGRLLYPVARQVLVGDAEAQDCVHDALLRAGSVRRRLGPSGAVCARS